MAGPAARVAMGAKSAEVMHPTKGLLAGIKEGSAEAGLLYHLVDKPTSDPLWKVVRRTPERRQLARTALKLKRWHEDFKKHIAEVPHEFLIHCAVKSVGTRPPVQVRGGLPLNLYCRRSSAGRPTGSFCRPSRCC